MRNTCCEALIPLLEQAAELLDQSRMVGDIRVFRRDAPGAEFPGFDDSAWETVENPYWFDDASDILLARYTVTVPAHIAGVAPAGPLRLLTFVQGPVEVYANGEPLLKERFWADSRTPEVRLSDDGRPGDRFVLLHRYHPSKNPFDKASCSARVYSDSIDSLWNDVQLMIAELTNLPQLPGAENFDTNICALLEPVLRDVLAGGRPAGALAEAFSETRAFSEPLRAAAKKRRVHLVGHAHIDMNWLWNTAETRDVVRRDFKTVCDIMDEEPDFTFSQSQAAAYAMCEADDPALFGRVREKIRAGRWEVTAAAWVEHDANLPDGDSSARQILCAKQYTREKLGAQSDVMWAPDTFGHSANLPGLLRAGGCENYFFSRCGLTAVPDHESETGKASDLPVFWWEGLDGSRVLAANLAYGGSFRPRAALQNALAAAALGLCDSLFVYGVGDHGGAPTRRDIRWAKHAAASPLFPDAIFSTAGAYFRRVRESGVSLPVRKGEMNAIFEACYTTHADIKRAVRKLCRQLYDAEAIAALTGGPFPRGRAADCWKALLFHQFHDIFDGCAIASTYQEAAAGLAAASSGAHALLTETAQPSGTDENLFTVINTLPARRNALVCLPGAAGVSDEQGTALPCQQESGGVCARVSVPPFSAAVLRLTDTPAPAGPGWAEAHEEIYVFDNDYYHVDLSRRSGEILTYYDKTAKRYICQNGVRGSRQTRGRMGTYVIYEEQARSMSSWTLGETLRTHCLLEAGSCALETNGPLRAAVRFEHRFQSSRIVTTVTFDRESPVIRYDVETDWREEADRQSVMPTLRVRFAPQIEARDICQEIPFGSIRRPVIEAERPQLRWSAAVDGSGGLAVLNDCKYGIRCAGNIMELTLIHSAYDPDRHSDIGVHRFSFGLYAFGGDIAQSEVPARAAELEAPPLLIPGCVSAKGLPVDLAPSPNLVLSALKPSEDRAGLILRAYEAFGRKGTLRLADKGTGCTAALTDITETAVLSGPEPVTPAGSVISFAPNEIKTFLIRVPLE